MHTPSDDDDDSDLDDVRKMSYSKYPRKSNIGNKHILELEKAQNSHNLP